jgi:hypothetical protein
MIDMDIMDMKETAPPMGLASVGSRQESVMVVHGVKDEEWLSNGPKILRRPRVS